MRLPSGAEAIAFVAGLIHALLFNAMTVIVDGYNALLNWPLGGSQKGSLKERREAFVLALADYAEVSGHPLIVVFDGRAKRGAPVRELRRAGIEVVFTGPGGADEVIVQQVAAARGREAVQVVTTDRQLARAVKARGARVRRTLDFAADTSEAESGYWAGHHSAPGFKLGDVVRHRKR